MYKCEAFRTTRPKYLRILGRLHPVADQKDPRRPLGALDIHTAIRNADTYNEFHGVSFSSPKYALGIGSFLPRNSATIKLTTTKRELVGQFENCLRNNSLG
jgi:hypothetical protein